MRQRPEDPAETRRWERLKAAVAPPAVSHSVTPTDYDDGPPAATYRIEFTQPIRGIIYARQAFTGHIGQPFILNSPGDPPQQGVITDVQVAEDGRSITWTIDVPNQPTALTGGLKEVSTMKQPPIQICTPVHYRASGPAVCRAAFVTETNPENPLNVGLMVANPTAPICHPLAVGGCHYGHPDNGPGGEPEGGTWHWPGDCT